MKCQHQDLLQLFLLKMPCSMDSNQSSRSMLFEFADGLQIYLDADETVRFLGNTQSPNAELVMEFIDVVNQLDELDH